MVDEFKELKNFIEKFEKVISLCEKGEDLTENERNFLDYYQLHLAIAILVGIGDDNAKKVAKIILGQID